MKRNAELSNALEQTDKASESAIHALAVGISGTKRGTISQKLKSAQNAVTNSVTNDPAEKYFQDIAFDELDMILGKLKGATSYKAINAIDGLTNSEKKILERVFNAIKNFNIERSDEIINAILKEFSRK